MKAAPKVAQCTVCRRYDAIPAYQKFSIWMYQCHHCGVAFTFPVMQKEATLARYSQAWFEQEYLPSYGVDPSAPSLAHLSARHLAELAPAQRFRRNNRLLDVGAGAGLFLWTAREAGWQVAGVEIASYGPIYAKQHFGLDIYHGTVQEAGFPSDYFDVVMLQDTIEHVVDPRELLTETNRILQPGGAVVLSTPNFDSLSRHVLRTKWSLISPLEHVHLFNMRSLQYLFQTTGFAVYRLESEADINPDFIHGERTASIKVLRAVLSLVKRPQVRPFIFKLSLGDKINAIGIKQG